MTINETTIHGHRGCRGWWPENTIKSFQEALCFGATAIELDIVLTKNGDVLVSHDPYMHHTICSKPDFSTISEVEELSLNIFEMTTEEAQQYCVGIVPHSKFPEQHLYRTSKPLLKDAITQTILFAHSNLKLKKPTLWNIEIKSKQEWDNIFHPEPAQYVESFLKHFNAVPIKDCSVIQSFDARILEELHNQDPSLRLVYLSDSKAMSVIEKLSELSFVPFGFSPNYLLLNDDTIHTCTDRNIELMVWTVNEVEDLKRMLDIGIRHIITDYPDRIIELKRIRK